MRRVRISGPAHARGYDPIGMSRALSISQARAYCWRGWRLLNSYRFLGKSTISPSPRYYYISNIGRLGKAERLKRRAKRGAGGPGRTKTGATRYGLRKGERRGRDVDSGK